MISFLTVYTNLVVVGLAAVHVHAWPSWLTGNEEVDAVAVKKFDRFWSNPSDIIANLDDYESLWIKPHTCV
jgi:hypothetical protein